MWDEHTEADPLTMRTITVTDISPEVNEGQLRAQFERYGKINSARFWRVPHTGGSIGFGFVRFVSQESAERALEVDTEIAGHTLCLSRMPPIRSSSYARFGIASRVIRADEPDL